MEHHVCFKRIVFIKVNVNLATCFRNIIIQGTLWLFNEIYIVIIQIFIQGDREVTENFLFNMNEKVRHVIILFVCDAMKGYIKFCSHYT